MSHHSPFALTRLSAMALLLLLVSLPGPSAAGFQSAPASERLRPLKALAFTDTSGRTYDLKALSRKACTVFVFFTPQCPISNIYSPRVREFAAEYGKRRVQFVLVDSNGEDSLQQVRSYAAGRSLTMPVVKDQGARLADILQAHTTPEAIVVDRQGVVRYRGRIDDNKDRAKVIRHDLRDALDALLAGRPIVRARTPAFGCAIFRDRPLSTPARVAAATYSRDIAPILNEACVSCHRPGGSGPFSLTSYQEAKTWGVALRDYTARRLMPPWKAVPGFGDFQDARTLSEGQIAAIRAWVASGSPAGDLSAAPPTPKFPAPTEWALGPPDVILEPSRPYHLAAEGDDDYRNFVMPIEFKQDAYVKAIEFQPGNAAVVHHVVAFIDRTGESLRREGKESEPGFSSNGTILPTFGSEWGEVWVPGRSARRLPPGVAVHIAKGSRLVMQVHYHKNGAVCADRTRMGIYFAKEPIDKIMQVWLFGNMSFHIAAGDSRSAVRTGLTLPYDVHLHMIFPHMHLLGREMKVTATFPDGTVKPLVYVNDWDFNWQETYAYREPVALPKGTRLELQAYYDNSENNPHQPVHPPQAVTFGEDTTDEMCFAFLSLTPDDEHLGIRPQPVQSAAR